VVSGSAVAPAAARPHRQRQSGHLGCEAEHDYLWWTSIWRHNKLKVRQVINYAIDRAMQTLVWGLGQPMNILPPLSIVQKLTLYSQRRQARR
jgi:hypothetical protein